jgi:hypothetical protein
MSGSNQDESNELQPNGPRKRSKKIRRLSGVFEKRVANRRGSLTGRRNSILGVLTPSQGFILTSSLFYCHQKTVHNNYVTFDCILPIDVTALIAERGWSLSDDEEDAIVLRADITCWQIGFAGEDAPRWVWNRLRQCSGSFLLR